MNHKYSNSEEDRRIMLAGFKAELAQFEASLPQSISSLGESNPLLTTTY